MASKHRSPDRTCAITYSPALSLYPLVSRCHKQSPLRMCYTTGAHENGPYLRYVLVRDRHRAEIEEKSSSSSSNVFKRPRRIYRSVRTLVTTVLVNEALKAYSPEDIAVMMRSIISLPKAMLA